MKARIYYDPSRYGRNADAIRVLNQELRERQESEKNVCFMPVPNRELRERLNAVTVGL